MCYFKDKRCVWCVLGTHLFLQCKLVPGRDGVVRAAELTTLDKSQRIIRVKRPIQKLYPLEVLAAVSDKSDKTVTMVIDEDVPFVRTAQ